MWSLHQLYDLTGEEWLLDLARTVHGQGYDWSAFARALPYPEKVTEERLREYQRQARGVWMNNDVMATHGVNVAMGLKAPAVWSRQDPDAATPDLLDRFLAQLDLHHGQATGMFTCDEHLAGRQPVAGNGVLRRGRGACTRSRSLLGGLGTPRAAGRPAGTPCLQRPSRDLHEGRPRATSTTSRRTRSSAT